MKKIALLVVITTMFFLSSFSQIQAPPTAVNDFALSAYIHYKFGNGVFYSTMNQILIRKGYSLPEAAVIMENLKTDSAGREIVLAGIANVSGDMSSIFNSLYSLEMSAKNAKDLAYYVYQKYGIKNR